MVRLGTEDGMATRTVEERLASIEAMLPSFATKEDLFRLETRIVREMAVHLRWMIGIQLGGFAIVAAAVVAIMRLLGS